MPNCTKLELLLSKLRGVKKTKVGYTALCPTHDDHKPSLSVSIGDKGGILLRCHARSGCEPSAIVAAVGMTMADLAPPDFLADRNSPTRVPPKKSEGMMAFPTWEAAADVIAKQIGGAVVATWSYRDASGTEVARIVRIGLPNGEKEYRPVRLDSDGWRIGGVVAPRPLYCLPDLASASRVYVTEGEKAADAARAIGLTATTSMHGALSPGKTDWSPLAGNDVVILPDNDKSGHEYAIAVAGILLDLTPPAQVRIAELPGLSEKGDIFDWVNSHEVEEPEVLKLQVEKLANSTAAYAPPVQAESVKTHSVVPDHQGDGGDIEPADPWPGNLDDAAYHGLAGKIVQIISPHSEADPVAVLIQVLVAFGNMIGRKAYFRAEADRHFGNLFVCLVGNTSKGRKGSSWGQVVKLAESIAPDWYPDHVASGLSSGEGLIWAVRDAIYKKEPIREGGKGKGRGKITGYQDVLTDEGVSDKRLMVLESEFASVLKNVTRERNTLSAILRQAWETGTLRTLTKNSPAKATESHISTIGHITRNELRKLITETDMANGLANRFLWHCVRRSKILPEGGSLNPRTLDPLAEAMRAAVTFGNAEREIRRDADATEMWAAVYSELSAGKAGLLGAATSRAESQVMRVAMLYALLDESHLIRAKHLEAGLAVWQHAEESARYIFGSALGDATADELLRLLRVNQDAGVTRTEIREHFQRHKSSEEIAHALAVLVECNLARKEMRSDTGGRPAETWFAI